jgi:hypothetical protein
VWLSMWRGGLWLWLWLSPGIVCSQSLLKKEAEESSLIQWCQYVHSTPEPDMIIFNRFMKCGSSTMNLILSHLQQAHSSFYFHSQNGVDWQKQGPKPLYASLQHILRSSNHSRMVVEGHFSWKDFGDLKVSMEYIQLLRNCPDRHTSNFFYRLPNHGKALDPTLRSCLFDEQCVLANPDIIYMGTDDYSETFCGWPCDTKSALDRLHPPGPRQFSVVGVLEQFRDYLEMLECVYPTIFRGVLDLPHLLNIRENVSGGSNRSLSRVVRKVLSAKCTNTSDESIYLSMRDLFSRRLDHMRRHRGECCRAASPPIPASYPTR